LRGCPESRVTERQWRRFACGVPCGNPPQRRPLHATAVTRCARGLSGLWVECLVVRQFSTGADDEIRASARPALPGTGWVSAAPARLCRHGVRRARLPFVTRVLRPASCAGVQSLAGLVEERTMSISGISSAGSAPTAQQLQQEAQADAAAQAATTSQLAAGGLAGATAQAATGETGTTAQAGATPQAGQAHHHHHHGGGGTAPQSASPSPSSGAASGGSGASGVDLLA
jgi:hypothetical protein